VRRSTALSIRSELIQELDQNILKLCTRINAATYELLMLVREFDERGGFLKWGLQNCAEWLNPDPVHPPGSADTTIPALEKIECAVRRLTWHPAT